MDPHCHRANTPWGELVLRIRPGRPPSAALMLSGVFLMDSESGVSEQALAQRGLAALRQARGEAPAPRTVRVLAGGLGLGITLRAILDEPAVGFVQVVELFPELVTWNRQHLAFLHRGALADARVAVETGDLLTFLDREPAAFDLVLLDIDNGPTMLALPSNERLYSPAGLARLLQWLAPGGVVVFWATETAPAFEGALAAQAGTRWWKETVGWRPARGGRKLSDQLYFLGRGAKIGEP